MLSICKIRTASGSTAVQVVIYCGHHAKVIKHIGSAKDEGEVNVLLSIARHYMTEHTGQIELFRSQESTGVLVPGRAKHIGVTHHFSHRFLMMCAEKCGLSKLPHLLLHLALMRLIEPASKLRTVWLLEQHFGISYSQRMYQKIPKLLDEKAAIEQIAFSCATRLLREQCYLVLYDVTTLYFETHKEDALRIPGFSKDDKSKQPQIVIGLLVTASGFPLAHDVFPGNTFEGNTMLPLLEQFADKHHVTKPIVVADAAMLSDKNIQQLKEKSCFTS